MLNTQLAPEGLIIGSPDNNVDVVDIGPESAQLMLTVMNTHNRNIKPPKVDQFARAMREGEWKFNGNRICISDTGVILDGQHQLSAIVDSGTTQKFIVVKGLPEDTQETMDTGSQRSIGDVLKLRGYPSSIQLGVIARTILSYKKSQTLVTWARRDIMPWEIVSYVDENADILLDSLHAGSAAKRYLNRPSVTSLASLHYLFSLVSTEDADAFFFMLRTGEGIDNESVRTLRKALTLNHHHAMNSNTAIAVTVKAFNYWREGRDVKHLSWRGGGSSPETFPQVDGLDVVLI